VPFSLEFLRVPCGETVTKNRAVDPESINKKRKILNS
jgi:hypothetical protein